MRALAGQPRSFICHRDAVRLPPGCSPTYDLIVRYVLGRDNVGGSPPAAVVASGSYMELSAIHMPSAADGQPVCFAVPASASRDLTSACAMRLGAT